MTWGRWEGRERERERGKVRKEEAIVDQCSQFRFGSVTVELPGVPFRTSLATPFSSLSQAPS